MAKLKYLRSRSTERGKGPVRNWKIIVIATEGQETEEQYFKADVFRSRKVKLEVLPTEDGESSPEHVFE